MGDWNVMHYVLIPSSGKYDLEFDYCKELENDEIDFSDYARRLDRASRIHQKCHWKLSAPSKIFYLLPVGVSLLLLIIALLSEITLSTVWL